jgi:hypothetical protein
MDAKRIAFITGVSIVTGTHLWLLQGTLPEAIKTQHAVINLAAAGLIVWSVL